MAERSPKTIAWHQTALGLFQQYLVSERHLALLCQITQSEVRGWVASLGAPSSISDTARSASAIATYVRSARAFCHWCVRKGYLEDISFRKGIVPKTREKAIGLIEPDVFDRLLLACHTTRDSSGSGERAAVRNRAIRLRAAGHGHACLRAVLSAPG